MLSRNKVFVKGNLGRDPEIRYTPSGAAIMSCSIACTDRYKDKDEQWKENVEWVSIEAWGKTAEYVAEHAKKGDALDVEGKIKTTSWEDKEGAKRYKTFVSATSIDVIQRGQKEEIL